MELKKKISAIAIISILIGSIIITSYGRNDLYLSKYDIDEKRDIPVVTGYSFGIDNNIVFPERDYNIVDKDFTMGSRHYDYGTENGSYDGYFMERSKQGIQRPVLMILDRYAFSFTPSQSGGGLSPYLKFSPDAPSFKERVAVKGESDVSINGINATYENQYFDYQHINNPDWAFANLTYRCDGVRIKEELVIFEKDFLLERYINAEYVDSDNVTFDFPQTIHAHLLDDDTEENELGIFYNFDRIKFKDFGVNANGDSFTTNEPVYFTNETNVTIFEIPELYVTDSNGNYTLINKTVEYLSWGRLLITIRTPWTFLNASTTTYPVYVDPTFGYVGFSALNSASTIENYKAGLWGTVTGGNGNLISINVSFYMPNILERYRANVIVGLYNYGDYSSNYATTRLATTTRLVDHVSSGNDRFWETFNLSASLISGKKYYLGVSASGYKYAVLQISCLSALEVVSIKGPLFYGLDDPWIDEIAESNVYGIVGYYSIIPSNSPPEISGVIPTDGQKLLTVRPLLNLTASDNDSDTMDITWYSNFSGKWKPFAYNNTVTNGSYSQTYYPGVVHDKRYWWNVSVDDGDNVAWMGIYDFVIIPNTIPIMSGEIPINGSVDVSTDTALINITIEDPDGDIFNWTIETSPDIGSNSSDVVDSWWYSDWEKRKPVYSNVSALAVSETHENYTLLINISYDSDMQSDFDDIRFVNYSDNCTEYSYWIKNKSASNYANVYVKVEDTITTTNRTMFWMYYCNSDVSNCSSYNDTFTKPPIYILEDDTTNSDLVKFNMVDGIVDKHGTTCPNRPLGGSLDIDLKTGDLYVACYGNEKSYRVTTDNYEFGSWNEIPGALVPTGFGDMGMDYSEKHDQYFVGDYGYDFVYRINKTDSGSAETRRYYDADTAGKWVRSVSFDDDGDYLYGTDTGQHIFRWNYSEANTSTQPHYSSIATGSVNAKLQAHPNDMVTYTDLKDLFYTDFPNDDSSVTYNPGSDSTWDFVYVEETDNYYIVLDPASGNNYVQRIDGIAGTNKVDTDLDSTKWKSITYGWRDFLNPEASYFIGSESNISINGSKTCIVSGLIAGTTYTWFVNASDGGGWNRSWFTFTTESLWSYDNNLSWVIKNTTGDSILKLSWKGDLGINGTLGSYAEKNIWVVKNITDIAILNFSIYGNLELSGTLYQENLVAPSGCILNMNNSFWLCNNGDLYIKDSFFEEIS